MEVKESVMGLGVEEERAREQRRKIERDLYDRKVKAKEVEDEVVEDKPVKLRKGRLRRVRGSRSILREEVREGWMRGEGNVIAKEDLVWLGLENEPYEEVKCDDCGEVHGVRRVMKN